MNTNSRLLEEIKNVVLQEDIKLVSVDIFDTLALRKIQPKEVFLRVGQKAEVKEIFESPANFLNKRVTAERIARENSPKEDITIEEIYNYLPIPKEVKKRILNYEVNEEANSIIINDQIVEILKFAKTLGKKIIAVSDMYLTKKHLRKIVFSKLEEELISDIYVSSEMGKLKATGNLYKAIKEKEKVDFNQWLHIGDNPIADYLRPLELGIKAKLYNVDSYLQEILDLEKKLNIQGFPSFYLVRKLTCLQNPYKDEKRKFFFNLGAHLFGPILWEFLQWLKNLAYKLKAPQVNFITREGIIFKHLFQMIAPEIETNILFLSRRSLILPALEVKKLTTFMKDMHFSETFPIYYTSSVKEIFSTLGLNLPKELNNIANLQIKSLMSDEKTWNSISKYLNKSKSKLKELSLKQRNYLLRYLKKVKNNSIFVELGGGGSIFPPLKKLLHKHFYIVTFYTHERGHELLLKEKHFSFLDIFNEESERAIGIIKRNTHVIESLLNGITATAVSYKQQNDKILPEVFNPLKSQLSPAEYEELALLFRAFISGMTRFFKLAKDYGQSHFISREEILKLIVRFLHIPTYEEATNIGDLFSDDGKEKTEIKKIIPDSLRKLEKYEIEKFISEFLSNINQKPEEIYWPQGIIAINRPSYLQTLHGLTTTIDSQASLLVHLCNNNNIKEVNIYGAGEFFRRLLPKLKLNGIKIIQVYDTKALVQTFKVGEFEVKPFKRPYLNKKPIIIASASFIEEISATINTELKKNGLKTKVVDITNGIRILGG